ncbi:unnamed protein product, partial [Symbiodinium microadriaticum]
HRPHGRLQCSGDNGAGSQLGVGFQCMEIGELLQCVEGAFSAECCSRCAEPRIVPGHQEHPGSPDNGRRGLFIIEFSVIFDSILLIFLLNDFLDFNRVFRTADAFPRIDDV